MLNDLTRSKLLQIWFTAVILIVVADIASGVAITVESGAMLLGVCLVPPAIVLMLWPRAQSITAGEVLRGERRE